MLKRFVRYYEPHKKMLVLDMLASLLISVLKKSVEQSVASELLKRLGDTQKDLKIIYIGGTKGRETIPAYVAKVLKCAGYKIGRYVPREVLEYREHFQIGGRNISMKSFCELLEQVKEICDQMVVEGCPSPDRDVIKRAIALLYFKQQGCDFVILSDSADFAENSLFVSENVITILVGSESAEIPKKVKHGLEKQRFDYRDYKGLEIIIAGAEQMQNAAMAIEVSDELKRIGFIIPEKALRKGLLETTCPGRFSVIGKKPFFVADIVCTAESAVELTRTIELYFPGKRILFVMGMSREADYEEIINIIHQYADWIITAAPSGRSGAMSSFELAGEVAKVHSNVTAVDSPEEAVEVSYLLAGKEDVIIGLGDPVFLERVMSVISLRHNGRKDR